MPGLIQDFPNFMGKFILVDRFHDQSIETQFLKVSLIQLITIAGANDYRKFRPDFVNLLDQPGSDQFRHGHVGD